jgi:hypothetical protein
MRKIAFPLSALAVILAPSAAQARSACHSEPLYAQLWRGYYEPGQIHHLTECHIPARVSIGHEQTFATAAATNAVGSQALSSWHGRASGRVLVEGSGWSLGYWTVRYRLSSEVGMFTVSRGAERVTFSLTS